MLAVDTSSRACSCALVQDGRLISESYCNNGLTHSSTLMVLVENTLGAAGLPFEKIDRLAVNAGPGSYTGLRIGISAVKGMAMAHDTPCTGVSTLLSLAYNMLAFEGVVCAALDARAGQVFAAVFSIKQGRVTRITDDAAMSLESLGGLLPDKAMICGDGARLVCERFPNKELRPAPEPLMYQRASSVAQAAITENHTAVPAYELEANYHRKPQAEREREAKQSEGEA